MTIHYLTKNKDSWIIVGELPPKLKEETRAHYNQLFNERPKEHGEVIIYDKTTQQYKPKKIFRYYKSYLETPEFDTTTGKSYMFSGEGVEQTYNELPIVFKDLFNFVQLRDEQYNQVVVNWYLNGSDYIEMHSDCTAKMIENHEIFLVNLNETDAFNDCRTLIIRPKEIGDNIEIEELDIKLTHGLSIIMGGKTQQYFRHGILEDPNITTSRISFTCRQMESKEKRINLNLG